MKTQITEIQKQIRKAQYQVNKGRKSGFMDAMHYAWQAELDRLNRELYALKCAR